MGGKELNEILEQAKEDRTLGSRATRKKGIYRRYSLISKIARIIIMEYYMEYYEIKIAIARKIYNSYYYLL